MNIHVPQTLIAQSEAKHVMGVKHNIISAQSNSPIMGIVQDSMIGSYLLTQASVCLTRGEFFRCLYRMPDWNGKIKFPIDRATYTGLELFSMTLPMVNFEGCGVKIRCGIMQKGQLTKGVLGTSHGSLIHVINNDCGPDECLLFMNRVQRVVHEYLQIRGFTFSISDIVSDNYDFIHKKCQEAFEKVKGETNEAKINTVLNSARDSVGKAVIEPLTQDNNFYCLVKSGAKGKIPNMTQSFGAVGQQNLVGKRIPLAHGERTLPHFKPGENTPQSRGFVESSYVNGLQPAELFFHAMSGREGVIDTAIKTAQTGYFQRKLMKALENLTILGDLSVRNSDGSIIQFLYGEDGFDGKRVEKQLVDEFDKIVKRKMRAHEFKRCCEANEYLKKINKNREPIYRDTKFWMFPVPIDRIILNAQTIFNVGFGERMKQSNIVKRVVKLIKEVKNALFKHILTLKLNSFKLYFELKVTDEHLDKIITDIQHALELAKIPQGESVGSICSQSIGEYITQMTLNTFHNTGNSSMNVTLGIPRLLELIDCVSNIKTPVMTFECKNPEEISRRIKLVCLEEVVESYKITDEPDLEEVKSFHLFPDEDYKESKQKTTLVLYLQEWYDVESIKNCLKQQKNLSIAYSEGPFPIFHIKYVKEDKKSLGYLYEQILRSKRVRGVDGADIVEIVKEGGKCFINTNLKDMREVWYFGIAMNSVKTNDVHSVYNTLGVEAARNKLIQELTDILAFYGLYVNCRHIFLLVDWMTSKGGLIPLTRHGIKEVDDSPLKMATFEEIVKVFTTSAYLKKKDKLKGISERILVGAPPFIGSNSNFDLIVDWENFEKHKQEPPKTEKSESIWGNFGGEDDEADIWGGVGAQEELDPWGDKIQEYVPPISQYPLSNQYQPQLHQNMFPQGFSTNVAPPLLTHPGFANQFSVPNQQQLVQNSTMPVSLVHQDDVVMKPPSPSYPAYEQPTSPAYDPNSPTSTAYDPNSPTSPTYDPTSPTSPTYDPTSPTSPAYSPTSPTSPAYSPTSPTYAPGSPLPMQPSSPSYHPYSPMSPAYDLDLSSVGPAYDPETNNRQKKRRTFFEPLSSE